MKSSLPRPATIALILFTVFFISLACLSGCASEPITKVDAQAYCDDGLAPALLTEPCASALALPDGATYQTGLDGKRTGDQALTQCGLKVAKLQQAIAACHAAVAQHNAITDALSKP